MLFLEKSHGQWVWWGHKKSDTTEQAQALKAHLKAAVQTLLSLLTSFCVHIRLMPESPGMGRFSGYPGLCVDRPLTQEKTSPLNMVMYDPCTYTKLVNQRYSLRSLKLEVDRSISLSSYNLALKKLQRISITFEEMDSKQDSWSFPRLWIQFPPWRHPHPFPLI